MVCLGNRDQSFLRLYPSTAFWTLIDYEGYSIPSKRFLPTVVDIMVIWIKFDHSCPLSSLIPKILMFALTISCLTTYNLPWFMDLIFQVAMQYCCLQHQNLLSPPDTSTAGCCFCICSAFSFRPELFLCSSLVAIGNLLTQGILLSVSYLCLFILFMGFSRQEC